MGVRWHLWDMWGRGLVSWCTGHGSVHAWRPVSVPVSCTAEGMLSCVEVRRSMAGVGWHVSGMGAGVWSGVLCSLCGSVSSLVHCRAGVLWHLFI